MPRSTTTARRIGAALVAACACGAVWADDAAGGQLRLAWTGRGASAHGPLALADTLQPGIAPPARGTQRAEAELRHVLRATAGTVPLALHGNVLLGATQAEGGEADADARVNELHVSADLGAWQASAGRKVVAWDVGHGYRPNDVVQQEVRRTLLAATPEGRPLLQIELFGADSAWSLVWVNPQRRDDASRGADESAFAMRGYQRFGALDAFAFARHGRHSGASVGAALAWVATDAVEVHASARVLQHHDGWRLDAAAGDAPVMSNPWRQATFGRTMQWALGASWTGEAQQGVLVEAWHDGTAWSDADWRRWNERSAALARRSAPPVPLRAKAGNLAWQATPFGAASLRRDNLLLRLSWQPVPWQLAFDVLVTPADRGRMLTASLQWQGDRWRLDAAWRSNGGPAGSVIAQLPTRRTLLLAATLPF